MSNLKSTFRTCRSSGLPGGEAMADFFAKTSPDVKGGSRIENAKNEQGRSELAGWWRLLHAVYMFEGKSAMPRRRRSASADAALRAELERLGQMTIEERVKAALSIRERFSWLATATQVNHVGPRG